MIRAFARLIIAALALAGATAAAHELTMAEMQVREITRGEFAWQWTASEKKAPAQVLTPIWPQGCQADGNALHCGEGGLKGTLEIKGVGDQYSAALVKVFWLDGKSRVYTITPGQRRVQLYGSADDDRGMGEIGTAYSVLGVEHILTGFDHLLFVLGLLFLVGFNRRLVWTITAFTAAHSLTLASAALGWLTLRTAPVEASIALSIVLVASEALRKSDTIARRWPTLVAFLFGLVHGLGFAGALQEIGLPENHLLVALLTFNLGVEAGQLLAVAAAWFLWRAAARWPRLAAMRTGLLYAIGSVAAYWSCLRIALIVGQAS